MKPIFIIPLLLISLVSFPSWGVSMDDLIEREGRYFQKFTIKPFTGEVSGIESGKIENGKKVGRWISYHSTGHPREITYYINGRRNGFSKWYDELGRFIGKGNLKNGKKEGLWELKEGQHTARGNFKNGKEEGLWEFYDEYGQVKLRVSFKNGVKVSE